MLRGSFGGTYPTHQASKVVERGTLARLGSGYSCDPLLPSTAAQACLSTKVGRSKRLCASRPCNWAAEVWQCLRSAQQSNMLQQLGKRQA